MYWSLLTFQKYRIRIVNTEDTIDIQLNTRLLSEEDQDLYFKFGNDLFEGSNSQFRVNRDEWKSYLQRFAPFSKLSHSRATLATRRAECRVLFIHSRCSCIPYSWANAYRELLPEWKEKFGDRICLTRIYSDCRLSYGGTDDEECAGACLNSCYLWTYRYQP